MPRPQKSRRICCYPDYWSFAPDQDTANDTVTMSLDEFETIRLIDYQEKTQEQCAAEMKVARTTVTAIYDSARKKLSAALVEGRRIVISGGNYTLDNTISEEIIQKGSKIMRIAVTYENGQIFQHFGRTEQFKLYDIADGKIINEQVVGTNGAGHGALAGFLRNAQADVLICGGIGGGAQMAMQEAGIALYGGNTGSADEAVAAFLANDLAQISNPTCDHHHEHGEGHSCGDHGCGSHSCGNH
ncbi:MAG: DUF134 domain-containing protein [Ruminococcus sp.]|uniref:DUF134 domain-containing protein n=1 Tax=Ruminococcus sp. TaxID=41978 RepID=UPI0025D45EF4|nr:DUF134 domain-containing protein [Ruminococcus sp.]MBR5684106.1 DUF134 domain-containing protein [Ruminococcus sp.]